MERFCNFCKKIYPHRKGIKSQSKFVIEMFNASGLTYFSAEEHSDYAKMLYVGSLNGTPKTITQAIRDTAPDKINVNNIRDFFFNHVKEESLENLIESFEIVNTNHDFNVFVYALAQEFKLYCEQDETLDGKSVNDFYEEQLANPTFTTRSIINERNAQIENLLLSQSGHVCPFCNRNPLYIKERGSIIRNYAITPLYPVSLTAEELTKFQSTGIREPLDKYGLNNLIAICLPCSYEYMNLHGDDKIDRYKELAHVKKILINKLNEIDQLNSIDLNSKIQTVLKKIKERRIDLINDLEIASIDENVVTMSDGSTITLNDDVVFDPKTIADKIKDDEDLIEQLNFIVLSKYKYIKAQLLLLDDEEIGFFDEVKNKVHIAYQIIKTKYSDKRAIITRLSKWIVNQIFGIEEAYVYEYEAFIVVAFFIQNCEVFEA